MSLSTAAAGFGVISRAHNELIFNLPFIGKIYLGMNIAEFDSQVGAYGRLQLTPRQDEKDAHTIRYYDSGENVVLILQVMSNMVCGIWFTGLVNNQMDFRQVYHAINNKMYFTDYRVDGYMALIKNVDTLRLREDTTVPAVDFSSQSLGAVVERPNKRSAQNNTEAWNGLFKTKDKYTQWAYDSGVATVQKMEKTLNELRAERERLKKVVSENTKELGQFKEGLDTATEKQRKAKEYLDICSRRYTGLLKENKQITEYLIDKGKLRRAGSGYAIELVEGSDETKTVPDSYFNSAKALVSELEEPRKQYMNAKSAFDNCVKETKKEQAKISSAMNTSWWKDLLTKTQDNKDRLNKVNEEIARLEKQLYRNNK